jgi:hypothetical protein
MAERGVRQVSLAEVADWLVRELEFGVGMHTETLPPWLTVRDLAAAWHRLEGGGETVEDWIWTIEAETGWPRPDADPDHAVSVPTSEHVVTVLGYGDAVLVEVAGAWNWYCCRDGCGIGAVCIPAAEQADRNARWHLEHEHDPLPTGQQHDRDVATRVRRDEHARVFVELAAPTHTTAEEADRHA